MPYKRIAENLLEQHCDLPSFEVDFLDARTSKIVAEELEKLGAVVQHIPHKSALFVICPASDNPKSSSPA